MEIPEIPVDPRRGPVRSRRRASHRDALLAEYTEVGSNFRLLTEIRFKLLAFLPIAAAAASAVKGESPTASGFALSLFGLAVTIGIVTYNARNDQLYDELIGRAAALETLLGIREGTYSFRPGAWLTVKFGSISWKIDHGTAVNTIYVASVSLWLFGVLLPVIEFLRSVWLYFLPAVFRFPHPASVSEIIALLLAAGITVLGFLAVERSREIRREAMRDAAARAVDLVMALEGKMVDSDENLMALCAFLANETEGTIRRRARNLAAENHEPTPKMLREAVSVVGCLTHLPPRWVAKCARSEASAAV